MPILRPTRIHGRLSALLRNNDRESGLESEGIEQAVIGYDGIEGDAHSGLTRASCVRVKSQYDVGTEIRNTRQLSILSVEELQQVADKMGIERIEPEWVGASLLLEGVPDLTCLPPSSRLIFEGGVSLVVDMENGPCKYPGEVIDKHHPGKGRLFASAAVGLRGITAWVERPGMLRRSESVQLHIPKTRKAYDPSAYS